jgi:hypothetical protein
MNLSRYSNYFHVKNPFSIHLFDLNDLWTGPQLHRMAGALVKKSPRLRLSLDWTAG